MVPSSPPKLVHGTRYNGVVVANMLPNNTYSVRVAGIGADVQCLYAPTVLAGLFGFKISHLLPQQTKVSLIYQNEQLSIITGCLPQIGIDPVQQNRNTDGPGSPSYAASQVFAARNNKQAPIVAMHKPPVDLAEGEFQMDNLLGTTLKLLRGMAALSSGDLAAVECHLQDDMVRIISDTFKHHTAFGDYTIANDGGKLGVVWHGTSYDHEAWGLPRATDPKLPIDPTTKQANFSAVDGVLDDGRWRFSQYIGWLGNFINIFVTDPVNAVGKIAENQFRSGKFRAHVNNDGSLLIQSVADIVLEKVVRIPVPIPIRLPNDPDGNRSGDVLKNQQYSRNWQPSGDNLFEMVFQLREFGRWFNNTYSLARFYQLDRDFQVPTEAQTPAPDLNNGELDKATVNNGGVVNWRIAFATIRIYRDGSIQNVDAYGNSMTTTAIGYHIATPQDLYLEAGGSVNIVAGRDINLLAQKNVGITAVTQAVRIKAQTGLMLLSAAGHMVLEVLGNFVVSLASTLNLNGVIELNKNGEVNITGACTAQQFAAELTEPAGDGPHYGHIFPGEVAVPEVTASFMFQTSYGVSQLYQTVTQQSMVANEQPSSGTWNFASNTVAGRGSPWPGASATFLIPGGGESLNVPSSASIFDNKPKAMASANVFIKYQI